VGEGGRAGGGKLMLGESGEGVSRGGMGAMVCETLPTLRPQPKKVA
jgi:hypothetical protein